jgi:hypothetical protein
VPAPFSLVRDDKSAKILRWLGLNMAIFLSKLALFVDVFRTLSSLKRRKRIKWLEMRESPIAKLGAA